MKNFKNWFNAFSLVLLFTIIMDLIVNTQRHSINGKKTAMIIITLSVLLCALIIRNLFILKRGEKKDDKRSSSKDYKAHSFYK